MYEDCVGWKVIVVVDYVTQVRACFVAFSGIWDEELAIGFLI
jgi:hypothetical protein